MRTLILLVCFVFTAMSLDAVWRQCDASTYDATGKWEFLTGNSVYSSPAMVPMSLYMLGQVIVSSMQLILMGQRSGNF